MAIFRTISMLKKIVSLTYKVSRLTKQIEKDVARARKGKLKPSNIRKTFILLISIISQIQNEVSALESHIQRTVGPEVSTLMSIGSAFSSSKPPSGYKKPPPRSY